MLSTKFINGIFQCSFQFKYILIFDCFAYHVILMRFKCKSSKVVNCNLKFAMTVIMQPHYLQSILLYYGIVYEVCHTLIQSIVVLESHS